MIDSAFSRHPANEGPKTEWLIWGSCLGGTGEMLNQSLVLLISRVGSQEGSGAQRTNNELGTSLQDKVIGGRYPALRGILVIC